MAYVFISPPRFKPPESLKMYMSAPEYIHTVEVLSHINILYVWQDSPELQALPRWQMFETLDPTKLLKTMIGKITPLNIVAQAWIQTFFVSLVGCRRAQLQSSGLFLALIFWVSRSDTSEVTGPTDSGSSPGPTVLNQMKTGITFSRDGNQKINWPT